MNKAALINYSISESLADDENSRDEQEESFRIFKDLNYESALRAFNCFLNLKQKLSQFFFPIHV